MDVVKGLPAEPVLAQGLAAAGDGAGGGSGGEDAVDARLAHFVVAFRVDEEAHVRVEVARGLADGADFYSCSIS